MHLLPPEQEMQRAFLASDAEYNGLFFTARSSNVLIINFLSNRTGSVSSNDVNAACQQLHMTSSAASRVCVTMSSDAQR